jgi:hypothetical protein
MSYGRTSTFLPSLLVVAVTAPLAACSSAEEGAVRATELTESAQSAVKSAHKKPTITFAADWADSTSAPLVAGVQQDVVYAAARLPSCRGNLPGGVPGWTINAFYAIDGIPLGSFPVAGQGLSNTPAGPLFTPPFAGNLAMWFEIGSAWGCTAYDSAYGSNYSFTVAAPANAPGWVGGASVLIDRGTCGSAGAGGPCYADATPADSGFTYGTWARQDAVIHQVYFDVWKAGVTDHANPDLWKELDVQLGWRVGTEAAFTTSYVAFSENTGNNARYAIDLSALDPLPTPHGGPLTSASQCPAIPLTVSSDGQYVQSSVQYFFTANGVALAATGGGALTGLFQNYAGMYAPCLPAVAAP